MWGIGDELIRVAAAKGGNKSLTGGTDGSRCPRSLVAPALGEQSSPENPVARNAAVLLHVQFARFMILVWKFRENQIARCFGRSVA